MSAICRRYNPHKATSANRRLLGKFGQSGNLRPDLEHPFRPYFRHGHELKGRAPLAILVDLEAELGGGG